MVNWVNNKYYIGKNDGDAIKFIVSYTKTNKDYLDNLEGNLEEILKPKLGYLRTKFKANRYGSESTDRFKDSRDFEYDAVCRIVFKNTHTNV